ncbi:MAG: DUF488 domain-containing protein, partial [Candidatus Acidiferrales bacterium]
LKRPSMIAVKRVYEPAQRGDGYRVLVDRLWPRGLTRKKAAVDLWLREVAPSNELRRWFAHDPAKWPAFRRKYRDELRGSQELRQLRDLTTQHRRLTLLYGSKERRYNNAVALTAILKPKRASAKGRKSPSHAGA